MAADDPVPDNGDTGAERPDGPAPPEPDNLGSDDDQETEADAQEQAKLDQYVDTLKAEHHGKFNDNPLTDVNARKALEGPPGTEPYVGAVGSEGADVTFRDEDGNEVARRDVKTNGGSFRGFEDSIRVARKEMDGDGEAMVQVPDGVDEDTTRQWVDRFQNARTDDQLGRYSDVNARFVDRAGNELGSYPLGERLRDDKGDPRE